MRRLKKVRRKSAGIWTGTSPCPRPPLSRTFHLEHPASSPLRWDCCAPFSRDRERPFWACPGSSSWNVIGCVWLRPPESVWIWKRCAPPFNSPHLYQANPVAFPIGRGSLWIFFLFRPSTYCACGLCLAAVCSDPSKPYTPLGRCLDSIGSTGRVIVSVSSRANGII